MPPRSQALGDLGRPGQVGHARLVVAAAAEEVEGGVQDPLPPLFPLLVAGFAFNFNNFLLIYLLTGGGPDMVGATVLAGETDILVSYTFRIAFQDAGKNFGYASAIATIIFLIVAAISYINLRLQDRSRT